jgi:CheY-like chemotaxis protein
MSTLTWRNSRLGQRLLVVEDDRPQCCLLQALLESEGFVVDAIGDGQRAWETLEQQSDRYTVILLDMNLPRMTGLQLIQALRQQGPERLFRVLAMSADPQALRRATELGVCHVLEKPLDLGVVLALVATYMN